MAEVGALVEKSDRPAYVRFKRVAVENKQESIKQGKFVAVDVDYALITPPYSKDCVEIKVTQWFTTIDQEVNNGRMPKEWSDTYRAMHKAWLAGQELPLEGTPIRGWGVLSPAQQENLLRINILTVEDLAGVNDEGMKRIGMGALDLKTKARTWLATLADKGPLTQKIASLEMENGVLKGSVETLQKQVEALQRLVPAMQAAESPGNNSITVDDILPEPEKVSRNRK